MAHRTLSWLRLSASLLVIISVTFLVSVGVVRLGNIIKPQSLRVILQKKAACVFTAQYISIFDVPVNIQTLRTISNGINDLRRHPRDRESCPPRRPRGQNVAIGPTGIVRFF